MREIIRKYKAWKSEHPDSDWQYDEIFDFINGELSRGELQELLEYVENKLQVKPAKK